MTVGQDEAITLLPVGILGIVFKYEKIQGGENLRHAKGACRMSGSGRNKHLNDVLPNGVCYFLQLYKGILLHRCCHCTIASSFLNAAIGSLLFQMPLPT